MNQRGFFLAQTLENIVIILVDSTLVDAKKAILANCKIFLKNYLCSFLKHRFSSA